MIITVWYSESRPRIFEDLEVPELPAEGSYVTLAEGGYRLLDKYHGYFHGKPLFRGIPAEPPPAP